MGIIILLVNSSSQTSIVNLNIPHLCKRNRERKRDRCNVRCIGASVHSEFSKIRAGCRLWELMGRRRHSLLFRISLILTELALVSTSATSVLFPLSLLLRLLVLTLFTASWIFMVVASFMHVYPTCRVKIR